MRLQTNTWYMRLGRWDCSPFSSTAHPRSLFVTLAVLMAAFTGCHKGGLGDIGAECDNDDDCRDPYTCMEGKCGLQCDSNEDCEGDDVCVENLCAHPERDVDAVDATDGGGLGADAETEETDGADASAPDRGSAGGGTGGTGGTGASGGDGGSGGSGGDGGTSGTAGSAGSSGADAGTAASGGTGGSSGEGGTGGTSGDGGSSGADAGSAGSSGSDSGTAGAATGGAGGSSGDGGSGGSAPEDAGGDAATGGGDAETACTSPPATPTGLQASDGTSDIKISLQWNLVPCADSYEVARGDAEDGPYAHLAQTTIAVYDDLAAEDTAPQYYRVRACSASTGCGAYSDPVQGWRRQGYVLVTSWGTPGSGDGQFSSPYGVAVDSAGNIYVLDTYNHRVQKFDSEGNFLTKWGGNTLSGEEGKFYYPHAIAVRGDYVYVGDDGGSFQKFSLDGTYVDGFRNIGDRYYDVDLDDTGVIYLAADIIGGSPPSSDTQVQLYSPSYALQTAWGSSGEGPGEFGGISYGIRIAVDSTRSLVYVSDTGHSKIQYFTLTGTYAGAWGTTGTGSGQFSYPDGITLDALGDIYIADRGNDRVQKYTLDNATATLVASWTSVSCTAIAVDSDGMVVVLADGRVEVYRRR